MNFFRRKKEKIKKCCNGVISILLCIIITPVITIAGMLVEFSRYQSTINLINEIMDSSVLSVLADYDTYIKDRFGLYAISQETDISGAYNSYFGDNAALLGNAVTISDTASASGDLALSNNMIVQQQVLDFAEATDLVEFFLGDMNLDALLEAFDDLAGIGAIADTANDLANAATAIETAIQKAKDLKTAITNVANAVTEIKSKASSIVASVSSLYDSITTDSFTLTDDSTFEEYVTFVDSYLETIKSIKSDYDDLVELIEDFPDTVTAVGTAVGELKAALEAAKEALNFTSDDDSDTTSAEGTEAIQQGAEQSGDLFEQVIAAFEGAIDEAYQDIESGLMSTIDETIETFKTTVKDELIEGLNLEAIINSVTITTVDGQRTVSISEAGKEDIKSLVQAIINGDYSGAQTIIENYIPNLSFSADDLNAIIQSAIDAASDALEQGASDAVSGAFTDLVNALKGIFDLDVFYEKEMCAYISESYTLNGTQNNPFQTILNTISDAIDASEDLIDALEDFDLLEALKAIKDLFSALSGAIDALVDFVEAFIKNIEKVIGWFDGSGQANFYEYLIIAAYMSHNLPDRTCAGTTTNSTDVGAGTSTNRLNLVGSSLTGFDFNNIPVSSTGMSFNNYGLFYLIRSLANKSGGDAMFKGAELEYILGGTRSEIINQIIAFFSIYFIRFVLDIVPVMKDLEVQSMATAANVFGWIVYILVLIGEPLLDTVLIVNTVRGEDCPVPLIKGDAYLSPTGIPIFLSDLLDVTMGNEELKESFQSELSGIGGESTRTFNRSGTGNIEITMNYQTYLWLAMLFTLTSEDMTGRLADLIYLEAGEYYGNNGGTFDINKTYTAVNANCSVDLESFLGLIDFADDSILQKRFTRTRGY